MQSLTSTSADTSDLPRGVLYRAKTYYQLHLSETSDEFSSSTENTKESLFHNQAIVTPNRTWQKANDNSCYDVIRPVTPLLHRKSFCVLECIPEEDPLSYMPTEVQNHINRLTMEVEGKVQNPLEDATVYINCAVYENGLLESPTKQTAKTIDLCADKKIHFIEKSIERSNMATKDEENNEYGYMNGDCTADELKKFQPGGYVAKTRVFQTQEIRITKTRKPLSAKSVADNEKNVQFNQVKTYVEPKNFIDKVEVGPTKWQDQVDASKDVELQSAKHKQDVVNTAEEPPRKKRYLCRDIVIPAYGQLYKNEGLTYPSAKLRLDARSWSLPKGCNPDADKIAEIVYTTFRPRVHKVKHVRLLFPPPYHPKDPEPAVRVQVVPPIEEKPEEIVQENAVPVKPSVEDEENDEDPKLSKRGRKKRNWFQRMWRNLRHHFRANEQHRDA